jgi:hypothetical protein
MQVSLRPHPTSPPSPIAALTVVIDHDDAALRLRFVVEGRIDDVAWPEPADGRVDELWRRTCFEAFVQANGGYVEFNLSPSGQWASYRFDAPRQGMRNAVELTLPSGARRLGLSAVIEATDGTISYWALAHPSDKPDFHHPDSFVLELP